MRAFRAGPGAPSRHDRGGWRHVPAALVAAAFLLPLVFMVTGSLRRAGLPPPRTPELVPSEPTLDNYRRAFELVDLARYTFNSALVVAIAVPLTLLVEQGTKSRFVPVRETD